MAQTRPWIAAETSNPSEITVTDRTASGPAPDGTPPTGNVDWSSLTGTPTSAAGYGIVNGSELDAFAALGATGLVTRTAANTYAARTLTAGDNVSITNGSGVAGNPSISVPSMPWADVTGTPTTLAGYGITDAQPLDSDLTTIAGLADIANSVIQRKSGSWAARTLSQYWTDLLADPTVAGYAYTALPWTIGTDKRLLGRDSALPPFSASEIAIGTGLSLSSSTLSLDATAAVTSITGTANEITASASVGAVTLSLPSALTFTGKTITGGTFNSGAFNGTVGATTPSTGSFTSVTASDSSYIPASNANAALRASGSFGGGLALVDGVGIGQMWMDSSGTRMNFGLGTSSGVAGTTSSITATGFQGPIGAATPSTGDFATRLYLTGADGAVSSPPTYGAKDFLRYQNNGNTNIAITSGTGNTIGIKAYQSGDAGAYGQLAFFGDTRRFVIQLGDGSGATPDAATVTSTGLNSTAIGATTPAAGSFTAITIGSTELLSSTVSLSSTPGAGAGTLSNAPAAGNPVKWLRINDNGVPLYIPAWAPP